MNKNYHRCDELAEECQLQESEVGPETPLTDLSSLRVRASRGHSLTNMESQPRQNQHQTDVEEVDEDEDAQVAGRV